MYHVYACGTGPSVIFHDAEDHQHFNWTLGKSVERYSWLVLMWVHLSTHVHLLVWTPEANLDRGMHRKYGRRGALFDGRYGCRFIQTDDQFLRTVVYIANNAVAAGLCSRAEDWFWSSYRLTINDGRTWPANGSNELVRRCGGLESLKRLVDGGHGAEAA